VGAFDVPGQVDYWKADALSTWDDARYLIKDKRITLGLFAVHLALEKMLKAQVIKETGAVAPKIHDLVRLAQIGKLNLAQEKIDFLSRMNFYVIQGRYLGINFPLPSQKIANEYLQTAKELIEWLAKQL
jgi:HEPN domain-containing protein